MTKEEHTIYELKVKYDLTDEECEKYLRKLRKWEDERFN